MTKKPLIFALIGASLAGVIWFYTQPNFNGMDLMFTIPITLLGGMIGGLVGSFSELKSENTPKAFVLTPFTIFLLVVGSLLLLGGIVLQSLLGLPGDALFIGGGGALIGGIIGSTNIRADR